MTAPPCRVDTATNRARTSEAVRAVTASSDELKLNAIATGAGVGQGALYRHFSSREDLLAEVYRQDVILLIGYLTRINQVEWDTRARHLLDIILDGSHRRE